MGLLKKPVTAAVERSGDGLKGAVARGLASGLYVGYIPGAHGTLGSLWGPLLCFVLPSTWLTGLWLLIPPLFIVGVWSSALCEKYWGHDPGRVVFDEVVGSLVTLAFIPLSVPVIWTGFVLFRLFDMIKPPPVGYFERLPHGWGVMSDDLMAGIISNILLRLIIFYYPAIL